MGRMLAERGWRGGWVGECGMFQHDRAPSQGSGRRLYGPYHRGGVGGALLGPYNLLILVVRGRFEIWEPLVFDFLKRGKNRFATWPDNDHIRPK
jgi:hypothetical protein